MKDLVYLALGVGAVYLASKWNETTEALRDVRGTLATARDIAGNVGGIVNDVRSVVGTVRGVVDDVDSVHAGIRDVSNAGASLVDDFRNLLGVGDSADTQELA